MPEVPTNSRPWVMAMQWHDLLFAHWPVDPALLRPHIPAALTIDTFDGQAWLAVVPFRMAGVRARCLPGIPPFSRFPELNLRTYVVHDGRPGVWFFSLDAADRLAVRVARAGFHLPYFDARMSITRDADGWFDYRSERFHRGAPGARFAARYRPTGPVQPAAPGSLDHFLTERYSLFAADRKERVYRGDIEHEPWPLQPAEWQPERCEMTALLDCGLPSVEPRLLFATGLEVRARRPYRVPMGPTRRA